MLADTLHTHTSYSVCPFVLSGVFFFLGVCVFECDTSFSYYRIQRSHALSVSQDLCVKNGSDNPTQWTHAKYQAFILVLIVSWRFRPGGRVYWGYLMLGGVFLLVLTSRIYEINRLTSPEICLRAKNIFSFSFWFYFVQLI